MGWWLASFSGVPNFAPSLYWLMVTGSAWAIIVKLKMSSKILKMRVKLIFFELRAYRLGIPNRMLMGGGGRGYSVVGGRGGDPREWLAVVWEIRAGWRNPFEVIGSGNDAVLRVSSRQSWCRWCRIGVQGRNMRKCCNICCFHILL